jgi:hypothetical protein
MRTRRWFVVPDPRAPKVSHRDARILINEGYRRVWGVEPLRHAAQLVQCVAVLESNYGQGWGAHVWDDLNALYGQGPHYPTWGAITAGAEWTGKTFSHRDSRPATAAEKAAGKADENGNVWYVTNFRVHESAAEAAQDLVRVVTLVEPKGYPPRHKLVMQAAKKGDPAAFSAALYDTGYYRGFGPDRAARIAGHHKAVLRSLAGICKALGEEPPSLAAAALAVAEQQADEAAAKSWAELRALAVDAVGSLDVSMVGRDD